jgi:putative DNA primase/helicase
VIQATDAFLVAMADSGLAMHKPSIIADGQIHRFRVEGDKSGTTNGWYSFHNDAKPFGAFGSWKTGQSHTWTAAKPESMTAAERQAMAERQRAARAAHAAETAKVQAEAAARALRLWERAKPATGDHPYLAHKAVQAYGVRDLRGQLVIPLRDVDGKLSSLQFIGADGKKTFLTGGRKRGCYHAIGRPCGVLCICEGYATGATIYAATGHATAIAFDAGNLKPVAISLRTKFPDLPLVICADNDIKTSGNPGVTAAREAARAVGAALAIPEFEQGVCHV